MSQKSYLLFQTRADYIDILHGLAQRIKSSFRRCAGENINVNINDYTNFERVFAMIASILPTPCYQDDINCQLIILECL